MTTTSPKQGNWRFYQNNAAEPTIALAAENTMPTLVNDSKLRLRVGCEDALMIINCAWHIQYSTDNASWHNTGADAHWDWADGLGTEGSNITGALLTGSTWAGDYHESSGLYETILDTGIKEIDCCLQQTANASASTKYYFKIIIYTAWFGQMDCAL